MKNIFSVLIFLPLLSFGQREVANDTTFIQAVSGKYYHINFTTYVDGGPSQTIPELLGDTAALVSYYANKAVAVAVQVSQASVFAMRTKSVAKILRQWDAAVLSLTGKSPLKSVQASIEAAFLSGSWTLQNGSTLPVAITKNAAGVLRYTVQGSTAKTIEFLGADWIVLKNHPDSPTDMNMFRVRGNVWRTVDGANTFRR